LVDENSRVLNEQRKPIAGLYAAGNTAASVMGGTYAGGGATIGAAMVAAYSAGSNIDAALNANTSVKSRAGETVF
jgi:3-oxosteroid 1-dehydrogenase